MFVLVSVAVEEFESMSSCSKVGSYHTFDEAHDAMVTEMEAYVGAGDPFDELEAEDCGNEGHVHDGRCFYRCSWHIFEV